MAHKAKYARGAVGHLAAHYERKKIPVKNEETGEVTMEYIKFNNQDIDPARTHLNYNLAPKRDCSQSEFVRQRTSEVRCLKRADVNVMCSWIVTLPKKHKWIGNPDLHVNADKDRISQLFFERVYDFLTSRYGGEQNVISAFVHRDEASDHMHYAFVPVVWDEKRQDWKVSAKEAISRADLRSFHTDLEAYLDSFKDWHFDVINEATKDGNKEIAELKAETAHQEVLQVQEQAQKEIAEAQQKASEARQNVLNLEDGIKPLREHKKALEADIAALTEQKDVLTSAEVKAIKAERTMFGSLKGVTWKEWEQVSKTAAEIDIYKDRAERAERQVSSATNQLESFKKQMQDEINRQVSAKNKQYTKELLKWEDERSELRSDIRKLNSELETVMEFYRAYPKVHEAYVIFKQLKEQEQQRERDNRKDKGRDR